MAGRLRHGLNLILAGLAHGLLIAWLLGTDFVAPSPAPPRGLHVRMVEIARPERTPQKPPRPDRVISSQPRRPTLWRPKTAMRSAPITAMSDVPNPRPEQAESIAGEDALPPPPVTLPRFDADYLSNPAPKYPRESRTLREQGVVVLRVHVSPQGLPLDIQIHASSGRERLDAAARAAVQGWRFVPARQGNEAIDAWVLVPVSFALQES